MVNSIHTIPASTLNVLSHETQTNPLENSSAQKIDKESEAAAPSTKNRPFGDIDDQASISSAAIERLRQDQALRPFVQQAMSQPAAYDAEKVSTLRGFVQSGRTQEYLSKISPNQLALSMLREPAGTLLRLAVGA
jgi:hypothetical protein